MNYEHINDDSDSDCRYAKSSSYPNVLIMVKNSKIVRLDFEDIASVIQQTPFAELQNTELSIKELTEKFSHFEINEHEYETGFYLVVRSEDKKSGMVAEYVNKKITAFRIGFFPHVSYVEGCS